MKLVRLSFLFLLCAAASLDAQWQLAPKPQAQFDVKSIFPQSPRLAVGAIDYGTMIHGGVFLTPDTGTTWKKVLDSVSVECVLMQGRTLVAGTTFSGLEVSSDSGTSWKVVHVNGAGQTHTSVVGTGGSILVSTSGGFPIKGGILRSTNGGGTWDTSATGLAGNSVVTLSVIDGSVYAGAYRYTSYAASGGIYRSTDQGANWTYVGLNVTVWAIASNGLAFFAGTDAGIYRSTDNGTTWVQTNSGLTALGISSLTTLGTTVLAGTKTGGVFQSTNSGTTWSPFNLGLTDLVTRTVVADGATLFAGTAHGMWKYIPGAVSVSQSTVSIARSSISSGDTTLVTLIAKDANGNRLTSGGLTVAFGLGSGTSGGTYAAVADSGNGKYTAVFTGTTSGTARTLTATINSSAVTSTMPTVTVTPPIPLPAPQSLTADPGLFRVTLHWKRPVDPRTVRYRIFGGTAPASTSVIDSVSAGTDSLLTRAINGLTAGTTYYFRLTAADSAGNESPFSKEVSAVPFGYGAISGTVTCDSAGLGGVTVRLLDSTSSTAAEAITDPNGQFFFPHILGGSYGVMLVEPLGYADTLNPKSVTVVPPDTVILQCPVIRVVTSFQGRTLAYWKYQFDVYAGGSGTAQESLATLNKDLAIVTGPLSSTFPLFGSAKTVADWDSLYRLTLSSPVRQWARAELGALVLNLASLKIAQYAVATQDGRTAADVAVYVHGLLTDADSTNDIAAFLLALECDLHLSIKAGVIPSAGVLLRVGDKDRGSVPTAYRLGANYPNPFNPSTAIAYDLPMHSRVVLKVYNTLGQCVSVLVDGVMSAGSYRVDWRPAVASGVYLYRLEAVSTEDPVSQFVSVKKMVLLK